MVQLRGDISYLYDKQGCTHLSKADWNRVENMGLCTCCPTQLKMDKKYIYFILFDAD